MFGDLICIYIRLAPTIYTHVLFLSEHRYPDEPSFVLPKCLKDKVEAGHLGRKSGRGFYYWDKDTRGDPV